MRYISIVLACATIAFICVNYIDRGRIFAVPPPSSANFSKQVSDESTVNTRPHYKRAQKPLPACSSSDQPAKSFLMVFMSRSGSTAICQTLASHPSIENKFEFLDRDYTVSREVAAQAINKTRAFFRQAIANGKIPGYKIRAFHVLADPEGWNELVKEFDTRIIWQYRKNVFKTSIGVYRRIVFNDYTATGGIKVEDVESDEDKCKMGVGCTFRIDNMTKFHEIVQNRIQQDIDMLRAVKALDGDRSCVFEMPYEDYLYYKEESMKDLFQFLGLKLHTLETFRLKATSDSLCDVVENFDDLCTSFYGCPNWQPYLDDFENNCRCTNYVHGDTRYCPMFLDRPQSA